MTDRTSAMPNWPYPFDRAARISARRNAVPKTIVDASVGDHVSIAIGKIHGSAEKLARFAGSQIANGARKLVDPKSSSYVFGKTGDEFKIEVTTNRAGEYIKLSRVAPVDPSTVEHKLENRPDATIRAVDSVSFVSPGKGAELIFVGAGHHLQSVGFVGSAVVDVSHRLQAVYENGELFARLIEEHAEEFLRQIADINVEAIPSIEDLQRAVAVGRLLLDARDVLEDPQTSFETEDELTARLGAVSPWSEKCRLERLVDLYEMRLDAVRIASANEIAVKAPDALVGPAFD